MKQLYLITGFLGSGKTTLMKWLIAMFSDRRIAVIVNEFGQVGVDGALLAESGVKVEEISNGSVFCVCRSDLFVDVLVQAMHTDAEIVLVETSGLSDPTGMGGILDIVSNLSGARYDFCGTIAVVEPARLLKLHSNVVAIKQQIRSAGLVLMNKTDIAAPEDVEQAESMITALNPVAEIKRVRFCQIHPDWLDELKRAQLRIVGGIARNTLGVTKMLAVYKEAVDEASLRTWLAGISPEVYRIKGFVLLGTGRHQVECVEEQIQLSPAEGEGASYLVLLAPGSDKLKRRIIESGQAVFQNRVTFE